ncbi:MAG: hypothetical protein R2745_23220 [Vicinamibacterales bacterium]
MPARTPARRGRPLKFGRPAKAVSLSLPADVLAWLESIDPDPAWAIVNLFDRARHRTPGAQSVAAVDLVQLPGKRGLILVAPAVFDGLEGVSVIRLSDGRGFLALEEGRGYTDLELAVADKLDSPTLPPDRREALLAIRHKLREWRQGGLRFESRAILVAERDHGEAKSHTLSGLVPA